MDQRVDGNVTARDVCTAAAKAGDAKSRAQLVPPPLPDHLAYMWEFWLDVCTGDPLTHRDIQAWAENTGAEPTGWEVATLLMMDRTYRQHVAGMA
jgi:hypothetical protein